MNLNDTLKNLTITQDKRLYSSIKNEKMNKSS